jgi:hypothetical protein
LLDLALDVIAFRPFDIIAKKRCGSLPKKFYALYHLGNLLPRAIRLVATKRTYDRLDHRKGSNGIRACSRANSSVASPARARRMIRAPRREGEGPVLAYHLRLRAFGRKESPSCRHCPAFAFWCWGSRFS